MGQSRFRSHFLSDNFIGRMSEINDRYCLETEQSFDEPYVPHTLPPKYITIEYEDCTSRFENLPDSQAFCNKLTPLYISQYPDLFVTYMEVFDMFTGKRNPL